MKLLNDLKLGTLYQVFSTFDGYDEQYKYTFVSKQEAQDYILHQLQIGDDDQDDFFIKEIHMNFDTVELEDLIKENIRLKQLLQQNNIAF